MKYFDIHSHLQFDDFDTDRELVVKRAQDAEVGIINVGTNIETSKQAIALAEENEGMYAIVGLHPTYDEVFDYEEMKSLAIHPKVVAIGECGIDLFHETGISLDKQRNIFEKHLMIAQEVGKPVMLHIRSGKVQSAYIEAIEIIKKFPEVKGNVHFFAGSLDEAKQFVELGYTISFTGAITYNKSESYAEVIKEIPLDMIMAETDCPYVAPVPYRGKRNEPSYVIEVYKKIAEIKGLTLEQVAEQMRENVKRVFGI
jgi:TatD DNase family protein